MKNTNIVIATLATMIAAMPVAQASHSGMSNYSDDTGDFYVTAKVLSTTPVFRYISVNKPQENCYTAPVTHTTRYRNGDGGAGMLLGGIIGGVLGNNLGHGKSRKATAIVGALIGSQIGNSVSRQSTYSNQYTQYESRCETQYISESQRIIDGYDVSYRFRGRVMTSRMPYDPGDHITLNISASPDIH